MLEQTGAVVFRMQSGKIPMRGRWIHLCPEGTADLLCFPRSGGVVWIETKAPKGRTAKEQLEAQEAFRQRVEAVGHRYIKAFTIDEGLRALQA